MLTYVKEGKTSEEIATLTETAPTVAALKCEMLIARGYPLRAQGYDSGFLRN